MPKVKQVKARKDYPEQGISRGQMYYTWSFRHGGTQRSLTRPRRSQLTMAKHSQVYSALEHIEDVCGEPEPTIADIVQALNDGVEEIRNVQEEYESADQEMGGHGGVNQDRSEKCGECADELERIAGEFSSVSIGPEGDYEDSDAARDALIAEATAVDYEEV